MKIGNGGLTPLAKWKALPKPTARAPRHKAFRTSTREKSSASELKYRKELQFTCATMDAPIDVDCTQLLRRILALAMAKYAPSVLSNTSGRCFLSLYSTSSGGRELIRVQYCCPWY